MKFSDVLIVNPDQHKLSGSPSPRNLLLESFSNEYIKKEIILENKTSEAETAIVIVAEEKLVPNCFNTFIAPHIPRREGFYFPRR
jgi:hypothetical protein